MKNPSVIVAAALLIALPAAASAQDSAGDLKTQIQQLTQQLQQQQQVIQQMKTRLDAMERHEAEEKAAPPGEAPPSMAVASAPPIPVAPQSPSIPSCRKNLTNSSKRSVFRRRPDAAAHE